MIKNKLFFIGILLVGFNTYPMDHVRNFFKKHFYHAPMDHSLKPLSSKYQRRWPRLIPFYGMWYAYQQDKYSMQKWANNLENLTVEEVKGLLNRYSIFRYMLAMAAGRKFYQLDPVVIHLILGHDGVKDSMQETIGALFPMENADLYNFHQPSTLIDSFLTRIPSRWSPVLQERVTSFLPSFVDTTSSSISRSRLEKYLAPEKVQGKKIVAFLKSSFGLNYFFDRSVGAYEGYSGEEHALRVYDVFNEQVRFHSFSQNSACDVSKLVKFVIALHDIGKPLAVQISAKGWQHEYTLPLMKTIMQKLSFSQQEIVLAETLVDNDVFGELIKNNISVEIAYDKLREMSERVRMPLTDFFNLQCFFYTVDAASYPSLRKKVFLSEGERLEPKGESYFSLKRKIFEEHEKATK